MFTGCAGFNANQAVTVASDIGLALVLKNNPSYKAPTLLVLNTVKTFLAGDVTYEQLITEINKYTGSEYSYIVAILLAELNTDTPISTSMLSLLDDYKADLIKRIDTYILIASI
jgi:hypothetical protein